MTHDRAPSRQGAAAARRRGPAWASSRGPCSERSRHSAATAGPGATDPDRGQGLGPPELPPGPRRGARARAALATSALASGGSAGPWRAPIVLLALALAIVGCGEGGSDEGSGESGQSDVAQGDAVGFPDSGVDPDTGGGPGLPDVPVSPDVPPTDAQPGPDSDAESADAVDAGPKPGELFYPCTWNGDCLSGYCVDSELGKVCTELCVENCPVGWDCVYDGGSGQDAVFICVSRFARLCKPCAASSECNETASGGHVCLDYDGDGKFCGADCAQTGHCPDGYVCEERTTATGVSVSQCVPEDGECECRASWVVQELTTACYRSNEHGQCDGTRTCTLGGPSPCSALVPAEEACNGVDDNCDGIIDPPGAAGCTNYWIDNDGDGFGQGAPQCLCASPGPNYATQGGDCNDANVNVYPGAPQFCNGLDDNCDGVVDGPGSQGCTNYFVDADGDGYGDPDNVVCLCNKTEGVVSVGGDCDDTNPEVNPSATDKCNGIDDNCDGVIDGENSEGCTVYFFDGDGDGFGVDGLFKCLCEPEPPYSALVVGDCDDTNPDIKPFAPELCDGIDNNCDGFIDNADPLDMCGPIPNGLPECVSGKCVVGSCEPTWFNVDGSVNSGCECKSNAAEVSGPTCSSAHNLGSLSDNGATVTVQGIAVYDDESDWYRFTGVDGPDPPQGAFFCDTYHVRVRFLWNPENTYMFDVWRGGCASANQICVENTDFSWRTNFYENKKGECPCHPNKPQTAPGVQHCTDNTAGYWVRVYRNPAKPPVCQSYNLEITNGVY